jgi:hypothetical protein
MTSDEWHRLNPDAAGDLFGFRLWCETRVMLWVLWPELGTDQDRPLVQVKPSTPISAYFWRLYVSAKKNPLVTKPALLDQFKCFHQFDFHDY